MNRTQVIVEMIEAEINNEKIIIKKCGEIWDVSKGAYTYDIGLDVITTIDNDVWYVAKDLTYAPKGKNTQYHNYNGQVYNDGDYSESHTRFDYLDEVFE